MSEAKNMNIKVQKWGLEIDTKLDDSDLEATLRNAQYSTKVSISDDNVDVEFESFDVDVIIQNGKASIGIYRKGEENPCYLVHMDPKVIDQEPHILEP